MPGPRPPCLSSGPLSLGGAILSRSGSMPCPAMPLQCLTVLWRGLATQCSASATSRLALPAPCRSTLCRRSPAASRRTMPSHSKSRPNYSLPTPSESIRCRCRAAQLRAGECLAVAKLNCADAQRSLPCLCESAQCRCLACPHYAAAPRAVSLPCAIAMPSLPRRSPATQRLAHAFRFIAQPCPCYATQCPSIAAPFMAKAELRLSLPMQRTALPPRLRANHRRRRANRCLTQLSRRRANRCTATALPSLAHASHRPALPSRSAQRRAIPRHCLAGPSIATPLPSVAVSAVPLLNATLPSLCDADFTLPLRRTPRIAAALLMHCLCAACRS